MYEYYPLLFVGAVVGLFSVIFTIAYMTIKNKKEELNNSRNVKHPQKKKKINKVDLEKED